MTPGSYTSNKHESKGEEAIAYQTLLTRFGELVYAIEHVINDSPGTPDSVKQYLRDVLRGSKERGA